MGDTKDKKLRVHIVHSVKGGSGKTAFSLFKAMTIANYENDRFADKANVLYMDADFKGTAIKTLIYGKNESEFRSLNGEGDYIKAKNRRTLFEGIQSPKASLTFFRQYQDNTLNDYLKGYVTNICDILVNGGILGQTLKDGETQLKEDGSEERLEARLDFIFSSPNIEKKKWFQYGGNERSTPEINLGLCISKMKKLLEQILECKYQDLVIDMPPGNDEYSNALLDIISEWAQKKKVEVYFYAITTNDLTHINAEYEKFLDVMANSSENKHFERYIMIYNELRENEFSSAKLEIQRKALDEILKNTTNRNKIYYVKCKYREDYYKFCREAEQKNFEYRLNMEETNLF